MTFPARASPECHAHDCRGGKDRLPCMPNMPFVMCTAKFLNRDTLKRPAKRTTFNSKAALTGNCRILMNDHCRYAGGDGAACTRHVRPGKHHGWNDECIQRICHIRCARHSGLRRRAAHHDPTPSVTHRNTSLCQRGWR